MTVFWRSFS